MSMNAANASAPETPGVDAAFWAVRLAADDAGAPERAEAAAWVADDPRRAGQLLRAQAVLHLATTAAKLSEAAPIVAPKHQARLSRRQMIGAGTLMAASFALALLLPQSGQVSTDVGEIRQLPLADGSTVALNTASRLRVRYADDVRRLDLPAGEALFRVAPAASRPFVVTAGTVTVTAIGTIFAVRHQQGGIEVLVTEGIVEVRQRGVQPVRLAAGQRGRFGTSAEPIVAAVPPEEAARSLAWRDGRLEFNGEPMADAIGQVNRHNRRTIRLADPALGREPVFGAFRTDDPAGFARAVAASLGQPVAESPREILIGNEAAAG